MRGAVLTTAVCLAAGSALAQSSAVSQGSSSADMASLIDQGYEIKTSVPNGTRFIVFLQKEKSAYACEFVSVTGSRCKSIN